jgi:hypothetical protein
MSSCRLDAPATRGTARAAGATGGRDVGVAIVVVAAVEPVVGEEDLPAELHAAAAVSDALTAMHLSTRTVHRADIFLRPLATPV